jgi:hypothetical protein
MNTKELKQEYEKLQYLEYTLHELPTGVLYDANGANETKCAELMKEVQYFEELSEILGVDNSKFIENCRWHYERYPHYLSRQKHFGDYGTYKQKHNGSSKVKA